MRNMMVVGSLLWAVASYGQNVITPDLKAVPEGKGWRVKEWKFNSARAITNESTQWVESVKGKSALRLKGIAWVEGVTVSNGAIECDVLGRSKGPNFLGFAFRGANDYTYDCVYFRPFTFAATDEHGVHHVQYTSRPQWTWKKLREERTGQCEKRIEPPPDGDEWFHARIVVAGKKVAVFVNHAEKPSLEVETLNDRTSGMIGLWTDPGSLPGHFANLKITPKENRTK